MLRSALAFVLFVFPITALAETNLLMAEEHGCVWCERWDEEISHIYPKTAEGKAAPLRRFDLHKGTPEDIVLARPVHYTPTFILVQDGKEIDRLEGYPGEDFFWALLAMMLDRANIPFEAQS